MSEVTLQALREASTATLTTQLLARGLRNTHLQGIVACNRAVGKMIGQAFTVRSIPAREDVDILGVYKDYDHPQRRAVESVGAGDVLVLDSRGRTRAGSLGHILATRVMKRGAAGIVTDGAVRDMAGIEALDLPVFAAGVSPTTNLALHHVVDMQVPIACGDVPIYPGDVIVADRDGVICVPRHLADEVSRASVEQDRLEEFVLTKIQGGLSLRGVYPPDETTLAEYERYRRVGSAGVEGASL